MGKPRVRQPLVHVSELGLDERFARRLAELGYGELWPSQEKAAPVAVAGKNLVLAVPTASGKSLVAYLALLTKALKGGKGLYLVPLRALASEKYEDLRDLAKGLGLRVAISIGDLDDAEPGLADFDVIVATSEKADALLRHRAHWLSKMSCVVADEVHLINEPDRGPTMEVLLARFRQLNPTLQVIALSATVANSKELAQWLGAEHVASTWRPVTLREGIHYGRAVKFTDNSVYEVQSDLEDPSLALAEDSVKTGGQCLVFVNTRKSTEALAEKLATSIKKHLDAPTREALKEAAESIKTREDATTVEGRLAKCVAGGAAFHHAGLTNVHRALVERLFKEGRLKALSATPTLAAGINLPARRVVVRDLWRYDVDEGGNQPLPVMEYKQMAGRAGRPKYDKVGEAITLAKTSEQRSEILLSYVLAESEKVLSKLGTETALRSHILASIASGFVDDDASLKKFIQSTFYAHQNDLYTIEQHASAVVDFLLESDMIRSVGERYEPTKYGKRVSELYIDPMSAVKLREALARSTAADREVTDVSWLHAACATPDVRALFVRRNDAWVESEAVERADQLLLAPPAGLDYEWFLAELKTAMLLHDWIEETTEDDLVKKYTVYPGDIRSKTESAEWLLHAAEEIARTLASEAHHALERARVALDRGAMTGDRSAGAKDARKALDEAARWLGPEKAAQERFESRASTGGGDFVTFAKSAKVAKGTLGSAAPEADAFDDARGRYDKLSARAAQFRESGAFVRALAVRVREGAKAELLPLLKFRGIGRYRARQLWRASVRSEKDLKAVPLPDLVRIPGIGPAVAKSLKAQVGEAPQESAAEAATVDEAPPEATPKGAQRSLGDFPE